MQKCLSLAAIFIGLLPISVTAQFAASSPNDLAIFGFVFPTTNELAAPLLNRPVYLEEDGDVQFSWASLEAPAGCKVSYELKIYRMNSTEAGQLLFAVETPTNTYIYTGADPVLLVDERYKLVVDARLTYPDRTELLEGNRNAIVFEYIPECTPPQNVRVTGIGNDNFEVLWDGLKATLSGVNYLVRCKPMDGNNWTEVVVDNGKSIQLEGLDNRFVYEIAVKKLCPAVGDEPELESDWVALKDIVLPSSRMILLPSFTCGTAYTPAPCAGVDTSANAMDTLWVGGIPILVDTMWISNRLV